MDGLDTMTLFDNARNRKVPIALYPPMQSKLPINKGVVIFSHAYGQNAAGTYLNYSYLTNFLAGQGYFVVSIQHELPTDSLIPKLGIPSW